MPSSVKFIQGTPARLITTPARILDQFRPRLYARMERVLAEAVQDYIRFTESRPSASSGKAGRVDTGAMRDAVSYRVEQSMGQIVGDLGFLNEQAFYYFLQTDTGFTNWRSGEWIAPTYALRDAANIAFQKLVESRV